VVDGTGKLRPGAKIEDASAKSAAATAAAEEQPAEKPESTQ